MSTPPTTQVPVTLITCMVPVIAEVGDQLLIFNGVCLGVSTSKAQQPKPIARAKTKAKALPKHRAKTKPKAKSRPKRASASTMNARVAKVKELLAIKPTTGKVLITKLKITPGALAPILIRLTKENALVKPAKLVPGIPRLYQLRTLTPEPTA